MAENYRMINTKFWVDGYVRKLKQEERLLFIYLLTNEHANILGIYELPIDVIVSETGIKEDTLIPILEKFEKSEKIYYRDEYIFIKNFLKYQSTQSPTVKKGVLIRVDELPEKAKKEIELILGKKLRKWIQYTYGIYTTGIKGKEKELKRKVKGKEKEKNGFSLLDFFKKSFVDKFGSEPAISEERDLQIIEERIELFKTDQEGKDFITAYFDSDKGKDNGYTLSACFTDHTINLWKTGGLTNNQPSTNCDA